MRLNLLSFWDFCPVSNEIKFDEVLGGFVQLVLQQNDELTDLSLRLHEAPVQEGLKGLARLLAEGIKKDCLINCENKMLCPIGL